MMYRNFIKVQVFSKLNRVLKLTQVSKFSSLFAFSSVLFFSCVSTGSAVAGVENAPVNVSQGAGNSSVIQKDLNAQANLSASDFSFINESAKLLDCKIVNSGAVLACVTLQNTQETSFCLAIKNVDGTRVSDLAFLSLLKAKILENLGTSFYAHNMSLTLDDTLEDGSLLILSVPDYLNKNLMTVFAESYKKLRLNTKIAQLTVLDPKRTALVFAQATSLNLSELETEFSGLDLGQINAQKSSTIEDSALLSAQSLQKSLSIPVHSYYEKQGLIDRMLLVKAANDAKVIIKEVSNNSFFAFSKEVKSAIKYELGKMVLSKIDAEILIADFRKKLNQEDLSLSKKACLTLARATLYANAENLKNAVNLNAFIFNPFKNIETLKKEDLQAELKNLYKAIE